MTKTVMIYDQCGEEPIKYYILPGDFRHLDRVYINRADGDEALMDELVELMYDSDSGKIRRKGRLNFPHKTVRNGAHVIVAGFLP